MYLPKVFNIVSVGKSSPFWEHCKAQCVELSIQSTYSSMINIASKHNVNVPYNSDGDSDHSVYQKSKEELIPTYTKENLTKIMTTFLKYYIFDIGLKLFNQDYGENAYYLCPCCPTNFEWRKAHGIASILQGEDLQCTLKKYVTPIVLPLCYSIRRVHSTVPRRKLGTSTARTYLSSSRV